MAFPAVSPTTGTDAQSLFVNKVAGAGLAEPAGGLNPIDYIAAAVGNLITDSPPAQSVLTSGQVKSSGTLGLGYATGAGGAVTQITSRATGVTLNKICGTITTNATSLAAATRATFVVTNSTVALGDTVVVSQVSGSTADTSQVFVSAVAAGSFSITLANLNAATADTGAMIINFAVVKAVSA